MHKIEKLYQEQLNQIKAKEAEIEILNYELKSLQSNKILNDEQILKYLKFRLIQTKEIFMKFTKENKYNKYTPFDVKENFTYGNLIELLPKQFNCYKFDVYKSRCGESASVHRSRGWNVTYKSIRNFTLPDETNHVEELPWFVSGNNVIFGMFGLLGDSIDKENVTIVNETETTFKIKLERQSVSNVTYRPFGGSIVELIIDKEDLFNFIESKIDISLEKREAPRNPNHFPLMYAMATIEEDENLLDIQTHKFGH